MFNSMSQFKRSLPMEVCRLVQLPYTIFHFQFKKLVPTIFYQINIFHQMIALQKLFEKAFFVL